MIETIDKISKKKSWLYSIKYEAFSKIKIKRKDQSTNDRGWIFISAEQGK